MCSPVVPLHQKIIALVTVAFLCLNIVVGLHVSADMPYVDYISWDEYSKDLDGAISYVGDNLQRLGHNTGALSYNLLVQPIYDEVNNVEDYFGVDFFPNGNETKYYDPFADWYLGHGNADGGGYRDGSPTLNTTDGSYSWGDPQSSNAVYLDDGSGGFFTVVDNSRYRLPYNEIVDVTVYHRGKIVARENYQGGTSNSYPKGSHSSKPWVKYGVISSDGSENAIFYLSTGFSFWHIYSECLSESYILQNNSFKYLGDYFTSDGSYSTYDGFHEFQKYSFTVKSYDKPNITNNTTTVYTYDPTTNNFTNNYYYGADNDGQPCLYDPTNYKQINFNNDGTINSNNGNKLYLIPDFSKLSDIDLNYFNNAVRNYYNQIYINLLSQKNKDPNLTGVYSLLSQCIGQLQTISNNEFLQTNLLSAINSNIMRLFDKLGDGNNSDLMLLLLELKQGILGENPDNDNIIDLLKQIAENTTPSDIDIDDFKEFTFSVKIQSLSDLIWEKLDVVSYFKQLNSLLRIFFGSYYSNQLDFDNYFNVDNYLNKSDDEQLQSLSTADFPEVYGEELAEEDIDINSSYYLQQSLATASVSDSDFLYDPSSDVLVAPSLTFTFFDKTYDLFDFITPDIIPAIRIFRIFIALVCVIKWLFWVIQFIPALVNDYDTGRRFTH